MDAPQAAAFLPRFLRWNRRAPQPEASPIQLFQRRIYVLPSGAGLAYAAALLTLLLASINYNLSLGYALTFLLGGVGVASLVQAFRNLLHLEIRPAHCAPVFQGESAAFVLRLENRRDTPRPALSLRAGNGETLLELPAASAADAVLNLPATRRGWLPIGRVTLETRFPLGLVRAWSILHPDLRGLVYPAPENDPPPLPAGTGDGHGRLARATGDGDFTGLRAHQRGDSPRHIAWKALARGGPVLTKQFAGQAGEHVELDWHALPGALDDEARLSRLAAWLLAAENGGHTYALRLPGTTLPYGHGPAHLRDALRLLALHGHAAER
ncbi:DUF58 domain-containing protein [Pseudothauera nasutitermitis]|uniref:DUF58 domain-containing protein n=1 Tax=Pseudothauera nasutitermitis TaxID=2565930 RepID=A0A4S4B117_9RHOO|nr:DUF58 domain-containing protein [Pseudothauera nasutitermitis]THF65752.1 DUF58 domain-containing protein [Pseudothauera nasutitermitis]